MCAHREGVWVPGGEALAPTADGRRLAFEMGVLGLVGGAAFAAGSALGAGSPVGLGVPLAGVALGFGAWGLHGRRRDDRERALAARTAELRIEFGIGPAWPVDLIVRQGEAPTGRDQGLLWAEAGRIVFSGFRTSFVLTPDQIDGPVRTEGGTPGFKLRLNLTLRRPTPVGPLALSFWPVADGWQRAEDDAANLRFALNHTIAEARGKPPSELVGQWPPTALGPGARSPREIRRVIGGRIAAATGLAAVVAAPIVLSAPAPGAGAFAVLALLLNWIAVTANLPRWQAYRDARRLWRET